jgi:hypothetical protein
MQENGYFTLRHGVMSRMHSGIFSSLSSSFQRSYREIASGKGGQAGIPAPRRIAAGMEMIASPSRKASGI